MITHNSNSATYYDILKIRPNATDKDVRNAYLELAQIYHPDKNPGKSRIASLRFKLINEAYKCLKTEANRKKYERSITSNDVQQSGYSSVNLRAGNDNKNSNKQEVNKRNFWEQCLSLIVPTNSNKQTAPSSSENR